MAAARKSILGVTLVELMVGVIVGGILAAVILPQLTEHRGEARLSLLDANLAEVRSAIELYAYQHGGTYPGARGADDPTRPSTHPAEDFLRQLTEHTDVHGAVRPVRDSNHPLGPYLRKKDLPKNPYTNTNSLGIVAGADAVVPPPADGETAWRFALQTGRFYANQPVHAAR